VSRQDGKLSLVELEMRNWD